jgi:hypothetical protein
MPKCSGHQGALPRFLFLVDHSPLLAGFVKN